MHSYLAQKFSAVTSYPNLGYQLDRGCPSNTLILGSSFAAALSDVEQYMDFSDVSCSVSISHNWNSQTRKVTGEVSLNFDSSPESGEYKIMLLVLQDSVIYKQYDYGMSTDFGIPYVEPSIGYIDSFIHNHVVRDGIINGDDSLWGESVISNPSNGESFSISFDYTMPEKYEFSGPGTITIPAKYDPEKVFDNHITLVAYVTRNSSEVVNATKADLIDDSTPLNNSTNNNISNSGETITLSKGIVTVNSVDVKAKHLDVYNFSGKKVITLKGGRHFNLNKVNLPKGKYLLKIRSNLNNRRLIKEWMNF